MIEKNPIDFFNLWYKEVLKVHCKEPTAMVLATCGKNLKPSARVVLLKQHSDRGFVFFTNMNSRKGKDISENPFVSLVFDWRHISKQVRVEGVIEALLPEDSDKYYATRLRGSQISACCSKQSSILEDREEFITSMKKMEVEFMGKPIPRPSYWIGLRVIPMLMEFWQEGVDRIHTRYQYTRPNDAHEWSVVELYP
ncbi:pyridoxamine 5'-phosphate oxidase [Ehrlichia ruminantium]|uniref:Pyridoxamine 5'-phosphate oxidase n=1 Tax=Ehrlichia ruminantium TaxID=779 RepID=A0AAE6QAE9_EHRRU|nr:pyridoxamine 5'-phosphate oxidase [Ehrlichia ruminantium]QGR02267.1 pyridoxamine 5'-phosphate oxidase [Ehrlichia ruminantium]QGR03188.1 pyridoxamine 5'-phosphate oxidase [Ehrlichia ruminantium]QGR04113.1 pyridoxamine 5'-phosphate oxidase [Ehrlichia ruminantium]